MFGDYIFILLFVSIGVMFIVIGSTILNAMNDISIGYLSKEKSLESAYDAIRIASMVSLYTGIAILVIALLCIPLTYFPVNISVLLKSIAKILFVSGIIITAVIIGAVYYTNAYNDIRNSSFYKFSRLKVRKALDDTLYYIKLLMQSYYGVGVCAAVILIGMIIYDVNKPVMEDDE